MNPTTNRQDRRTSMMTSHSEMEKRIVLLEDTLREAMWIIEAEVEAYGQRKEQHRWWRLLRDMKELLGD